MIGVFIPYDIKTSSIKSLSATLKSWDKPGFEPIAIEVKKLDNEVMLRVAAEAILSKEDVDYLDATTYIIAEIGSEPELKGEVIPFNGKGYKSFKKGQGVRVEACQPRVQ